MKLLKTEVKRMRPALGTFVEITLEDHPQILDSFHRAFGAIERVESLLSYFRPTSEIYRINQGEQFSLSPETQFMLHKAEELGDLSRGIFDVRHGRTLASWNLLPHHNKQKHFIDLGGIAKGYAVDQAVCALLPLGISGLINAGGDVRVFGEKSFNIHIKTESGLYPLNLTSMALATSSVRATEDGTHSFHVTSHGTPYLESKTVTVIAKEGWLADALTKVALMAPETILNKCLSYYDAKAFVFKEGRVIVYETAQAI